MALSFSKYQGAGNDFILVDDRSASFPLTNAFLIQQLCHRRLGIGADGLILLQNSERASFRMRVFNSDGKEAAMCGNGIRCLVQYLRNLGFRDEMFWIETMHSTLPCWVHGEKVRVQLGKPDILHWGIPLAEGEAFVVNTGVPHAVLFVEDLDQYPVVEIGRKIRFHPLFAPHGVNVNFTRMLPDGTLRMRTYERGVEEETLACGTGAAAVALVAEQKKLLASPIRVVSSARETLEISIAESKSGGKEIEMTAAAVHVFSGHVEIEQMGGCL